MNQEHLKHKHMWTCDNCRTMSAGDVSTLQPRQLTALLWSLAVMQQVDCLPFKWVAAQEVGPKALS